MKRLVIGCPIRGREWMIEPWFDAVLTALVPLDISFAFLFATDKGDEVIQYALNGKLAEEEVTGYFVEHDPYNGYNSQKPHDWPPDRTCHMTNLRNTLLDGVRTLSPDYFLSLDSDILLHPEFIVRSLSHLNSTEFAAIGGKTYLHPTYKIPSYANINKGTQQLIRNDTEGFFKVDVIMAIKMMSVDAYYVDYEWDKRGEDIGWSKAVKKYGLKMAYDGTMISKHIMSESQLETVDPRVGY